MKTHRIVGVVAFVALSGCQSQPQVPPPYTLLEADPAPSKDGSVPGAGTSDMDRGLAYIENEAFEHAVPHLQRAVQANPNNAEAQYYLALAHDRSGKRAEAESGYARALELDPKLVAARINLGALYLEKPPRPEKAIEVLTPAVELEPNAVDVHLNLAYAHRLTKNPAKAIEHYRTALKAGDDKDVRFALADALYDAGKLDEMVVELRVLMPHYEKDLEGLTVIAHRLAKGKAWDQCITAFTKAIALKSTEPAFFLHRGLCHHELGKEEPARADYQKALEIDERFQPAWYYLGMSFLGEKKRGKAADAFEKAMKLGADTAVGKKAKERYDAMVEEAGGGKRRR